LGVRDSRAPKDSKRRRACRAPRVVWDVCRAIGRRRAYVQRTRSCGDWRLLRNGGTLTMGVARARARSCGQCPRRCRLEQFVASGPGGCARSAPEIAVAPTTESHLQPLKGLVRGPDPNAVAGIRRRRLSAAAELGGRFGQRARARSPGRQWRTAAARPVGSGRACSLGGDRIGRAWKVLDLPEPSRCVPPILGQVANDLLEDRRPDRGPLTALEAIALKPLRSERRSPRPGTPAQGRGCGPTARSLTHTGAGAGRPRAGSPRLPLAGGRRARTRSVDAPTRE